VSNLDLLQHASGERGIVTLLQQISGQFVSPFRRRDVLRAVPADEHPDQQPAVEIPHDELSPEALRGVIESFVLREGTEYGERDVSLDQKVAQVTRQLRRGEAQIVFDPGSETIDIVVVRT